LPQLKSNAKVRVGILLVVIGLQNEDLWKGVDAFGKSFSVFCVFTLLYLPACGPLRARLPARISSPIITNISASLGRHWTIDLSNFKKRFQGYEASAACVSSCTNLSRKRGKRSDRQAAYLRARPSEPARRGRQLPAVPRRQCHTHLTYAGLLERKEKQPCARCACRG